VRHSPAFQFFAGHVQLAPRGTGGDENGACGDLFAVAVEQEAGFDRACPELIEGLSPNGGFFRSP
jgi:hypothetical protein